MVRKVEKSSSPFLSRKPPNSKVSKEEKASLGMSAGLLSKPSRPAQEPPNSGSTVVVAVFTRKRLQPVLLSCHHGYASFNLPNNAQCLDISFLPTKETEPQSTVNSEQWQDQDEAPLPLPLLDDSLLLWTGGSAPTCLSMAVLPLWQSPQHIYKDGWWGSSLAHLPFPSLQPPPQPTPLPPGMPGALSPGWAPTTGNRKRPCPRLPVWRRQKPKETSTLWRRKQGFSVAEPPSPGLGPSEATPSPAAGQAPSAAAVALWWGLGITPAEGGNPTERWGNGGPVVLLIKCSSQAIPSSFLPECPATDANSHPGIWHSSIFFLKKSCHHQQKETCFWL